MTPEQWAAHVRMMVALMNRSNLPVVDEQSAAWEIQGALVTEEGGFEQVPAGLNRLLNIPGAE